MASATLPTIESFPDAEPAGLYEVIDGVVVEKPPMGAYEAWLASELFGTLHHYVKERGLGRVVSEMLFLLDSTTKLRRRPDLAFVSAERWPLRRRIPRSAAWEVIPDLAIEVISPTNTADEVVDKLAEYFRAGVRIAWVVYPSQSQVYVYTSRKQSQILDFDEEIGGGDVLPGLHLALSQLSGDVEAE